MYLLNRPQKTLLRRKLQRLASFTLVELLVVIGIIALLAAILLPTANWAIKAAKRTKAFNTANQIQTAAMAYFTEYGVYPTPPTSGLDCVVSDTGTATLWQPLICILCGNLHPSAPGTVYTATTITNARGVAFLNMKATDVDASDAPLNPLPSSSTVNIYFNIAMNSSFSGVLGTNAPTSPNVIPNFGTSSQTAINYTGTSTAGVIVWANCNGNSTSTNANYWVHTY